ncbi:uncharacterized protein LY89DRAFT_673518 [Mollisia scopiformis]|uniref:Uncharacterized protein n=1 Tax=Mollisia scopiformis TaxID=149040 RepID=A0A194WXA4_MOLSC|nr:uncharacterized protein LY89DRAFT_673518 [Mollisia scopiformis]KUJ12560.1 hypothetical protein LY89DRAFT_673518 [Mollisia scopiformis]
MYTSSIIAAFTTVLALASAVPAPARQIQARAAPVVDVLVQTSPLNSANVQASAVQVILGEVKVVIGNSGFSPSQASKLSISPFGATTDITTVECQAFSDTKGEIPVSGIFSSAYPAILSSTATVPVGSIICEYI